MKLLAKTIAILLALSCLISLASATTSASDSCRTFGDKTLRGVWVRPVASLDSAKIQIDNIAKAGFNAIYLETFYHGFTIYPNSRYVPIRPEMNETDYLRFYIEEAHKRGIEVHAWIEVFYWEVDTKDYPQFPKTPLFTKHPSWRLIMRNGKTSEKDEKAHIFANPANPEVQKFLAAYVKEMLTKYPLDGINLDYVRYPIGFQDGGYDSATLKAFQKIHKYDPRSVAINSKDAKWQKWVEYREEQVLKTVALIKKARDNARPKAVLSAAIFPGPAEARYTLDSHFQNWREMMKRDLLDTIIPMSYAYGISGIEKEVDNVLVAVPKGSKVKVEPVLAIQKLGADQYAGTGHPPVIEQQELMTRKGIPGFSIFCYDWMMDSKEGLDLFKQTK